LTAAGGRAEARFPLSVSKVHYVARAGGSVRVELSDFGAATVKRAKSMQTNTTPETEHAPFATTDTAGNLVIAVPFLATPGRYAVAAQVIDEDRNVGLANVTIDVETPASVPKGTIPVVLLNGFQLGLTSSCPVSDASDTFGNLPTLLAQSTTVYWFDNCRQCVNNCPIELLGTYLGGSLSQIQYTDGTPVQQFDLVAHSMGGLIVRAYLSGKGQVSGAFSPPANPKVRRAVFIGTPHFGSFLSGDFGAQTTAMHPASQFLWDLNRWNQGFDDLREVDALAIAGNGSYDGKSDGVVSLTSATISFAGFADVRTRVIGGCHAPGLTSLLCASNQYIASSAQTQQIVTSFLAGSTGWQTVGQSPSRIQALSTSGGRIISFVSANNIPQTDVGNMMFGSQPLTMNPATRTTFYNEFLAAGSNTLTFSYGSQRLQSNITIPVGGYGTTIIKYPPVMTYARPAAAQINTLNISPGSLISIFGLGLASNTATSSFPWPTHLADVTLTANGQPLQLLYVGDRQINAYLPSNMSGLVTLQLTNSLGQHTLNVMTTNASPAIFSADSSGTGPAAAIHASTGQPVTTSNPATAGEYVEIYGTGFGSTYQSGGLNLTSLSPTVYIGNKTAVVTFCGMPQGSVGLYQINFIVPGGLSPGIANLAISMGNYNSNFVTLPVR
jgi:uncharacterized protein (TIGR03437 family)